MAFAFLGFHAMPQHGFRLYVSYPFDSSLSLHRFLQSHAAAWLGIQGQAQNVKRQGHFFVARNSGAHHGAANLALEVHEAASISLTLDPEAT
jgi:hypothetical protein